MLLYTQMVRLHQLVCNLRVNSRAEMKDRGVSTELESDTGDGHCFPMAINHIIIVR
jgi:hypothetical protein